MEVGIHSAFHPERRANDKSHGRKVESMLADCKEEFFPDRARRRFIPCNSWVARLVKHYKDTFEVQMTGAEELQMNLRPVRKIRKETTNQSIKLAGKDAVEPDWSNQ